MLYVEPVPAPELVEVVAESLQLLLEFRTRRAAIARTKFDWRGFVCAVKGVTTKLLP